LALAIFTEVTVGGMDATVEPSGMSLWRVTGVILPIDTAQI